MTLLCRWCGEEIVEDYDEWMGVFWYHPRSPTSSSEFCVGSCRTAEPVPLPEPPEPLLVLEEP